MEWRVGRVKLSNASLPTATTGDVYKLPRIQNTALTALMCVHLRGVCVCEGVSVHGFVHILVCKCLVFKIYSVNL